MKYSNNDGCKDVLRRLTEPVMYCELHEKFLSDIYKIPCLFVEMAKLMRLFWWSSSALILWLASSFRLDTDYIVMTFDMSLNRKFYLSNQRSKANASLILSSTAFTKHSLFFSSTRRPRTNAVWSAAFSITAIVFKLPLQFSAETSIILAGHLTISVPQLGGPQGRWHITPSRHLHWHWKHPLATTCDPQLFFPSIRIVMHWHHFIVPLSVIRLHSDIFV